MSYAVYGLERAYFDLGEHHFKIVLNPKLFVDGKDCQVEIWDCDGKLLENQVKIWGRKINCYFSIKEKTPDGVTNIQLYLKNEAGLEIKERLYFWIVKP